MKVLDAAYRYVERLGPVFPCKPWPDKSPYTDNGFKDASRDPNVIAAWWRRWPDALIGLPTGTPIDRVVLDIDMKGGVNGWATLARLESTPIPPAVPTVITASGGAHLYFARPEGGLRNTAGKRGRGIGPGLDWRGDGGYVILPSPGSGYRWSTFHFGNCRPLPVPAALLPKIRVAARNDRPIRPTPRIGLSPYGEAVLDRAGRAIIAAPAGEQEVTLNGECFAIGTLVGAGLLPEGFSKKVLLWAARQVRDHDPRRPWHQGLLETKVVRAFTDGVHHPRSEGHHAA